MWRPDFDDLWSGPWPHHPSYGVGLHMQGVPQDLKAFSNFLMDFSCHPKASARIYDRICQVGYDKLTVMSSLPFNKIAKGLAPMGVVMTIIAPLYDWEHRFDDGPFPPDFIPPNMR